MNYLKQILAFEKLSEGLDITSNARSMYYALLKKNNELAWINEFTIPNTVLQAISKIKHRDAFNKARQSLINSNLIVYEKGKKGQAGTYGIKKIYEEDEVQDQVQVPVQDEVQVPVQDQVQVQVQDEVQVPGTLNKQNKIKQNKEKKIYITSATREGVKQVTKYVYLKDEEIERLKLDFEDAVVEKAIEILDNYKANKPRKTSGKEAYKDDNRAIRIWAISRAQEEIAKEKLNNNRVKKSEKELAIAEKKEQYYSNKGKILTKNQHEQRQFKDINNLYD